MNDADRESLRAKYADYALARDLTEQQGFAPQALELSTPAALAARARLGLAQLGRHHRISPSTATAPKSANR